MIFPLPRILYAMGEDGLLFSVFAKVHPRFKTPTWGILIAGFLTGILSAIFEVDQLVNMISIGTVSNFFFRLITTQSVIYRKIDFTADGLHICCDLCDAIEV